MRSERQSVENIQSEARWYVLRTFKGELQARRDFAWEAEHLAASAARDASVVAAVSAQTAAAESVGGAPVAGRPVASDEGATASPAGPAHPDPAGPLGFAFDWFVPVHWQLERHNVEQPRPQMRPLVASYVFVRTTLERLRRIVGKYAYLYPYRPAGRDAAYEHCVWVGDAEMRSFMLVARAYEANRRFYDVRTADVVTGDRVRVVGGAFNGVEGVLQKVARGSNDGYVVVELPGVTRLRTWRIEARYIEILEFAAGSSGLYDNLEFFLSTAMRSLRASFTAVGVSATDVENLRLYVRRFRHLRTGSELTESTLRLLLFLSHRLLRDEEPMRRELARCLELLGRVKSEMQRVFLLVHLYAATGEEPYRAEARALMARWLPCDVETPGSAASRPATAPSLAASSREATASGLSASDCTTTTTQGRSLSDSTAATGERLVSLSPKKRKLLATLAEFETLWTPTSAPNT